MPNLFIKAKPVWFENLETEMYIRGKLESTFSKTANKHTVKIATSGVYNLLVNGNFVAYGPARAGKNHFRMDEYDITKYLSNGENKVVIDVCNYYQNSYYLQKQSGFVQAEITADEKIIAHTGGNGFKAGLHPNYIRKITRYSFQRPNVEAYNIPTLNTPLIEAKLVQTAPKTIIERIAPYPIYEQTPAEPILTGKSKFSWAEVYRIDRACMNTGEKIDGFPLSELDCFPMKDIQDYPCLLSDKKPTDLIKENRYNIYKLPYNATGNLSFTANCKEDTTLFITFDEILSNNDVDFMRLSCSNVVKFNLCKGEHKLNLFEVYSMKYIKVLVAQGECELKDLRMIEFKHPPVKAEKPKLNDKLSKIYDAALETFRQNAVDMFTDCPQRERAGWLCDSFFTARVEHALTGESLVEKSFLENFLHEDTYEYLPDGMLPMCYPADHVDKNFIPNWAMWLVIQLGEYYERTNDVDFVNRYKEKIYKFLNYLAGFENNDGLLEKLKGWVFVEWSMANELVQDVNYPTNMLYSFMLKKAANLYGDTALSEKAKKIKQTILEKSFNGEFFTDNAEYNENGVLENTGKITEVCQYYAFFCDIATPQTHKKLFETLIRDFGPDRKQNNKYPEIYFANAFIGNYLRLEVMMREGYKKEVLDNIEGYFYYMADRTGTLWEHDDIRASCNHGFASHVICWLRQ